jgi:hypothetical protein
MFLELSFTMIALSFLRSETVCGATLLAFQELYINGQTIVLSIVMILVGFDGTFGGHVRKIPLDSGTAASDFPERLEGVSPDWRVHGRAVAQKR